MERIFENDTHVVFRDGKTKVKITTKQPFVPVLEFDFSGIEREIFSAIADLIPSSQSTTPDVTPSDDENQKTKIPDPPKTKNTKT